MKPELMSINGGGNDIMRPRVAIVDVAHMLMEVVDRAVDAGARVLMVSGANPSAHVPLGALVHSRGNQLADAIFGRPAGENVTFVDNWGDEPLGDIRYWSADRLHLNPLGHARVASNVLQALGVAVPVEWGVDEVAAAPVGARSRRTAAYYREYVMPWIGRRLTGRSSGDGRLPKIAILETVDPTA